MTKEYATPFGDTMTWVTGEDETGGAFSLHERTAPSGARSPGHVHSRLIEAFYVTEGTFVFKIGDRTIEGGPGTFALAPAGVRHGWTVSGDAPARALVMFAPSAKRAYFEELDAIVRAAHDGQPDGNALLELMQRYDWL